MRYGVKSTIDVTYKIAKRIVVSVVGATLLVIGAVMIVTPGPAFVVLPLGLAVLGIEFAWARRWLRKLRERISNGLAESRGAAAESHRHRHHNSHREE
jgi:tellurite resistance protein TerC